MTIQNLNLRSCRVKKRPWVRCFIILNKLLSGGQVLEGNPKVTAQETTRKPDHAEIQYK